LSPKSIAYCRSPADEKVAGVNDSVASGNDSVMASGDVTMDSIKEHAKYESASVSEKQLPLALVWQSPDGYI